MNPLPRRSEKMTFVVLAAALAFCAVAQAQQIQQGVRVGQGRPPDRDGDGVITAAETGCPPLVNGVKATPDPAKGDADVSDPVAYPDSTGLLDYFMGEWKFVQGSKDLIVQMWCINRPQQPGAYLDHFTYRILTSEMGVNTEQVKADDEKT